MKRYALPLIILVITVGLLALIVVGGADAPDYAEGTPTNQPISAEWTKGNTASSVVIVEYSDFQCPACRAWQPLLQQVIASYSDRVAFAYRHFPLYRIHPNADAAARAAEAAGLQGKFWEMHDLLFEKQPEWDKRPNPWGAFEGYAQQLGIDVERFKVDASSSAVQQAVADDYARGMSQRVQGTPSFFLNGAPIAPQSYAEFAAALDAALGGAQ